MTLLAHERWMAAAVARRQAEVRSPRVLRFERDYGAEGVSLLSAGLATVVLGELLMLLGVALIPVSGLAAIAIIAVAAAMMIASAVRFVQAVRVGRTFRQV